MHPNKRSKSEQLDTSIHSWENSRKTGMFWKHSRGSRLRKLRPGAVTRTPCFARIRDADMFLWRRRDLVRGSRVFSVSFRPWYAARDNVAPGNPSSPLPDPAPRSLLFPQNVAGRGKNMGFRLPECRCRSIMTKNENEDDRCGASGFLRGELRFQEAGRRPVRTSTLSPRSCLPREAAGRFHRAPNGAHHRQS